MPLYLNVAGLNALGSTQATVNAQAGLLGSGPTVDSQKGVHGGSQSRASTN
jgi:hypothetical protein